MLQKFSLLAGQLLLTGIGEAVSQPPLCLRENLVNEPQLPSGFCGRSEKGSWKPGTAEKRAASQGSRMGF